MNTFYKNDQILEVLNENSKNGLNSYDILMNMCTINNIDSLYINIEKAYMSIKGELRQLLNKELIKVIGVDSFNNERRYTITDFGKKSVSDKKKIERKDLLSKSTDKAKYTEMDKILYTNIDGALREYKAETKKLIEVYLITLEDIYIPHDILIKKNLEEIYFYVYINKLINAVSVKGDEYIMIKKDDMSNDLIEFLENFVNISQDFLDEFGELQKEYNKVIYNPMYKSSPAEKVWLADVDMYINILSQGVDGLSNDVDEHLNTLNQAMKDSSDIEDEVGGNNG